MKTLGYIYVIQKNINNAFSFPLTSPICTIGRGPNCDIRVQKPNASMFHCQLECYSDGKVSHSMKYLFIEFLLYILLFDRFL